MEPLLVLLSTRAKLFIRARRKGAAVLETVILIIVAVVIMGLIVDRFVRHNNSFVQQIFKKIEEILNFKQGQ